MMLLLWLGVAVLAVVANWLLLKALVAMLLP